MENKETDKIYTIKTKNFEGPLDMLLSLIEKRKFHINDVALAKVADDFLERTKENKNISIGESAHFILIASTLVLIKSRSLLPTLSLSEDEEESINDLKERLILYSRIKTLSLYINEKFGKKMIFTKIPEKISASAPIFSPHKSMTIYSLNKAMRTIIANLPQKDFIPKILIKKVINLEEMMEELANRIQTNLNMSFSEWTKNRKNKNTEQKIQIIVGFLAMLELVKRGIIEVKQDKHFQDIGMETRYIGVPKWV